MKKKIFLIVLISLLLIISLLIKTNVLNLNEFIFNKLPIKTQVIIRNIKSNAKSDHSLTHIFSNFFNDNSKYGQDGTTLTITVLSFILSALAFMWFFKTFKFYRY